MSLKNRRGTRSFCPFIGIAGLRLNRASNHVWPFHPPRSEAVLGKERDIRYRSLASGQVRSGATRVRGRNGVGFFTDLVSGTAGARPGTPPPGAVRSVMAWAQPQVDHGQARPGSPSNARTSQPHTGDSPTAHWAPVIHRQALMHNATRPLHV